ncbi:GNAT family N-acetyltransferase [Sulfitobacter sp. JB4-11]|uniref:GNAT family N-acetyltransferase n=1 Tax=Sulfitobacter rhodophyticola TaxID=3238304 RepID=UPI00351594EA
MHHDISLGFSDAERPRVAALYWEAFAAKLRIVMGPPERAIAFLTKNMHPDFALVARDPAGRIAGLAGFKTSKGALTEGSLRSLAAHYGLLSVLWRAPLLALVERELAPDVLLMDGICVDQAARGTGLGTALLDAVKDTARTQGLTAVRLDVIDTNPRARALYERQGFVPVGTQTMGPLTYIFGFASSTTMLCDLA